MSKATKRKHVTRQVLDDDIEPDENQQIVKILSGKGNNLHEVLDVKGQQFLVSMPTKFRKNVWIKRGDFVIVEPIEEGNKVCAEIVHILYPRQIKYLKDQQKWPEAFTEKIAEAETVSNNNSSWREQCMDSDSDNDDDLFVNCNRPVGITFSDSDTDSSDKDQEEEEEEEEEEEQEQEQEEGDEKRGEENDNEHA